MSYFYFKSYSICLCFYRFY